MELAVITAKQVAELLLMILAGAVCCKAGVFKPKEKSVLANLLLYLVVPAMVLDSYMVEYDPATFHNLMLAFGLGALVLLVGLGVAFLASFKVQKDARAKRGDTYQGAVRQRGPALRQRFCHYL